MKRESQNDLRYIKTESLIQNTFKAILLEMDYSQITIRKLVERAQINRKTFYLHYQNLDDLLVNQQISILSNFFKTLPDKWNVDDLEKFIRKLFLFLANASNVDNKIMSIQGHLTFCKSPSDYIREQMFNYLKSYDNFSKCQDYEANIFVSYLYGSFIMIYSQWIIDGRKIPVENMIQFITKLISKGLSESQLLLQ